MDLASKWIERNRLRLWEDDDFEIKLPTKFKDGSSVVVHENGIAVTSDSQNKEKSP